MTPQQRADLVTKLTDEHAAALTVYGEARNQSVSGIQAVLSVIRNRVKLGKWGTSYAAVVLSPMQFSCWNDDDPNSAVLYGLAVQMLAPLVQMPLNPSLDVCCFVAAKVVSGDYPDNTNHSTHYFAPAFVTTPAWANAPAVRQTLIGAHAFYSGVR